MAGVRMDEEDDEEVMNATKISNTAVDPLKGHMSLAEMVSGHIGVWRDLLKEAKEKAPSPTFDMDDRSYYQHELNALADIEAACAVHANMVDRRNAKITDLIAALEETIAILDHGAFESPSGFWTQRVNRALIAARIAIANVYAT
jgi:hypothetical protein